MEVGWELAGGLGTRNSTTAGGVAEQSEMGTAVMAEVEGVAAGNLGMYKEESRPSS